MLHTEGEIFGPSISKQLYPKAGRCQNRGVAVGGTERESILTRFACVLKRALLVVGRKNLVYHRRLSCVGQNFRLLVDVIVGGRQIGCLRDVTIGSVRLWKEPCIMPSRGEVLGRIMRRLQAFKTR